MEKSTSVSTSIKQIRGHLELDLQSPQGDGLPGVFVKIRTNLVAGISTIEDVIGWKEVAKVIRMPHNRPYPGSKQSTALFPLLFLRRHRRHHSGYPRGRAAGVEVRWQFGEHVQ